MPGAISRSFPRGKRKHKSSYSVLQINQEKLLIKSCQQNKLINYMLPQIECSPMLKKVSNTCGNAALTESRLSLL